MPQNLPFQPLDKLCFAGTRAPFASGAVTWRLTIRGHLEREQLLAALDFLLAKYPVLASRVVALDGPIDRARKFAWQLDETPDRSLLFRELDLTHATPQDLTDAEEGLGDQFLDLTVGYPFVLTWIKTPPIESVEASVLRLHHHHALADGRAIYQLLDELIDALDRSGRGLPLADPGPPVPRLPELSVIEARGFSRFRARLRGIWQTFRLGAGGTLFPSHPLRCNLGSDQTGKNRTLHLTVPDTNLTVWKSVRSRLDLSVNDLLTGALAAALARWSARQDVPPGRTRIAVVVDTRPRQDRAFRSFANHLGSLILKLDLKDKSLRALDLARSIAQQTRAQQGRRQFIDRLLAESPLILALPIQWLRHSIFTAPKLFVNHTFFNLIPLEMPGTNPSGRWSTSRFVVEDFKALTPTLPPQGATTTVLRYGGQLVFNFNYKTRVLDATVMQDLVSCFEEALRDLNSDLQNLTHS